MEKAVIQFIIVGVFSGKILCLDSTDKSKCLFAYYIDQLLMVNTVRLEPLPYFALGDKMLLQLSSSMFLPKMV